MLTDQQIIQMLVNRNELAIKELNQKYGGFATVICKNAGLNREDTQECVNDTCFGVWNSIPPNMPENLKAYTAKITRRTAIDKIRSNTRKKRNKELDVLLCELENCIPSNSSVQKEFESKETINLINNWLKSIDEQTRNLFISRYFCMESIKSLAKKYDLSQTAVTTKLYRSRNSLKSYLTESGVFYE